MIINSPVGRLPFTATRLEVHGGTLRLEGAMGTWPTSVEVPIRELPSVIGQLVPPRRLALVAGAAVAALAVGGLARRRAPR